MASLIKAANPSFLGHCFQVLKLKEQLSDAEKQIQRLAKRMDGVSSNSPSSSLSMEVAMDAPFLGEFGVVEEYDDVFYVPENNYINGMEWMNLYMWTD